MSLPQFKYPSEWTTSYKAYLQNKDEIVNQIKEYIENYEDYLPIIRKQVNTLNKNFFSGDELYRTIANE